MACLEFLSKMPGKPGKCLEFQNDCSVDTLREGAGRGGSEGSSGHPEGRPQLRPKGDVCQENGGYPTCGGGLDG